MIIAIDPGREKCGLAVIGPDGGLKEKTIIGRAETVRLLPIYLKRYKVSTLVIGQGSFGDALARDLACLELKIETVFVPEKNSTREARKLYWQDNQPEGFWKFIPTSLRTPPRPVDDYAAVVLGKRHLKK